MSRKPAAGAQEPSASGDLTAESNGQPIRLDIRTLKMRELRDIENVVGHKIAQELAGFDFGMDTLQGLLWIALRRQRPGATFEDAGELDFEQIINGITGPEDEPPPPNPTLEPAGSKPPSSVGTDSTPRPPNNEPVPSSASSTA
jgi:hypothetical protein